MNADTLQSLLDEVRGRLGIAGAQLSLYDGTDQVDVASGAADASRRVPATPDTVFQVGSTTKVLNAVLVHQLVDAGRLDLDAPTTDVLPGLRVGGYTAAAKLTARDLISMRSGIDNGPYTDHGAGDDAVGRYVDALAEIAMVAEPGALFGYSNAATVIAGRMVEQLTGQPWEQALRTRLLEPAELRQSAASPADLPYHAVAVGHQPGADAVTRPWSHPRSLGPAGSTLCASAGDLVRLARIFLDRGRGLLSPASVDALQTPQIDCPAVLLADKWCAGAFWRQWDGHVVVGHSGTNLSGSSTLLWLPGLGGAIATTVNVPRLGYPLAAAILDEVLPVVFGVKAPSPPEPDDDVAVDAAALVGRYRGYGVEHAVEQEPEGGLTLTTSSTLGLIEPIRVGLRPLTPTTFLPDDAAASGNRGYAMAFVGEPGRPASHFMHGVFLSRRS